jgi:glycosyltransferase involved in cell wall biosynthesis
VWAEGHLVPSASLVNLPRPSVSVVVPAYRSALSLPDLVRRLQPVLEDAAAEYELILVDDGSRDGTWTVIEDLAGQQDWVRGVRLMRN